MIYFVWTAEGIPGRGRELLELVKTLTKIGQKYVPDDIISSELLHHVTGDRNKLHLVIKSRSLSAYESYFEKAKNDKDFQAAFKKYYEAVPGPIPGASGQIFRVDEDLD